MLHWLWYTLPLICVPGLERLLRGPLPALSDRLHARCVLAVAAHPDDLEYFCGGTLIRLAQEGARVVVLIATQGEGGGDPNCRIREQEEAAVLLGSARWIVLDLPDGALRAGDPRLISRLRLVMEEEEPDLLLTFDPDRPFPAYHHPDHFAVARAALSVWDGRALLFHTRAPSVAVEITGQFAQKVEAFGAHRSQLPKRGVPRLLAFHIGRRFRAGPRRYAEIFRELGKERPEGRGQ